MRRYPADALAERGMDERFSKVLLCFSFGTSVGVSISFEGRSRLLTNLLVRPMLTRRMLIRSPLLRELGLRFTFPRWQIILGEALRALRPAHVSFAISRSAHLWTVLDIGHP